MTPRFSCSISKAAPLRQSIRESLVGIPAQRLLGKSASELGTGGLLEGAEARLVDGFYLRRDVVGQRGRTFREEVVRINLVVVDRSAPGFREEGATGVASGSSRVSRHGSNNSLGPIGSIAESLRLGIVPRSTARGLGFRPAARSGR